MITESGNAKAGRQVPFGRRLHKRTALITRWLHVYLSMLSFAVVLFFAATGLTLNHPDWFAGQQRTVLRRGVVASVLVHSTTDGNIDRLGLVEVLRSREHVHGAVTDFRVDDSQIQISLRAPGYTADAFVDRTTGKYDLTEVSSGLVAVMNDLHKGHDAGRAWGWVVDASAVLLVLVSVTGLLLIWFVYKRRVSGLLLALFSAAFVIALYRLFVP